MSRLDTLKQLGISLYPTGSRRTHFISELETSDRTGSSCIIAGRINHIDTGSVTIGDATGKSVWRLDSDVDADTKQLFQELITGDIIECVLSRMDSTISILEIHLLVPSLRTESEHIPDSAVTLKSNLLRHTRRFFEEQGFLGVDTPYFMTVPDLTPGITSFKTTYNDPSGRAIDYYLQTSPEHYMKRLLTLGYEKTYQICRFFRDGERYDTHHPEFLGLEWYQAYADYTAVMQTTEEYIVSLAIALRGDSTITYRGKPIDLNPPWTRTTVCDIIRQHAGIDLKQCNTLDDFRRLVSERNVEVSVDDSWEDVFHRLFIHLIEPNLPDDRPVILTEYPAYLPSLAKCTAEDDRFVERFELYIGGLELANAFTELNDPDEQRSRFEALLPGEVSRGYTGGLDEAFLASLEYGMPPAGGIALGLDRLAMLFADTVSIDDVIAFRDY